jgi:hypothetical protein
LEIIVPPLQGDDTPFQPPHHHVCQGRRPKPDVGNLFDEQAHAPLPASRLDMRACHPASEIGDRVIEKGFPRPTPAFCAGAREN